jgi:hypothetical protein
MKEAKCYVSYWNNSYRLPKQGVENKKISPLFLKTDGTQKMFMDNIECRNCGIFEAESEIAESGIQYDCQNCNFRWFVPNCIPLATRLLAFISFGLIYFTLFKKNEV